MGLAFFVGGLGIFGGVSTTTGVLTTGDALPLLTSTATFAKGVLSTDGSGLVNTSVEAAEEEEAEEE